MEEDKTARMMSQPYLDIDFMGKPGRWEPSGWQQKPDNKSQSGSTPLRDPHLKRCRSNEADPVGTGQHLPQQ